MAFSFFIYKGSNRSTRGWDTFPNAFVFRHKFRQRFIGKPLAGSVSRFATGNTVIVVHST